MRYLRYLVKVRYLFEVPFWATYVVTLDFDPPCHWCRHPKSDWLKIFKNHWIRLKFGTFVTFVCRTWIFLIKNIFLYKKQFLQFETGSSKVPQSVVFVVPIKKCGTFVVPFCGTYDVTLDLLFCKMPYCSIKFKP